MAGLISSRLSTSTIWCEPAEAKSNNSWGMPESFSTWLGRTSNAHHIGDRKSTRLNSSHVAISYAVFCLKKKKQKKIKKKQHKIRKSTTKRTRDSSKCKNR